MNSEKANIFNGVDTQKLSTVFSSLQNQPEMAKVSFSVTSKWNGGFSVGVTASKGFRTGGQNIERNTDYKAQYDSSSTLRGRARSYRM